MIFFTSEVNGSSFEQPNSTKAMCYSLYPPSTVSIVIKFLVTVFSNDPIFLGDSSRKRISHCSYSTPANIFWLFDTHKYKCVVKLKQKKYIYIRYLASDGKQVSYRFLCNNGGSYNALVFHFYFLNNAM